MLEELGVTADFVQVEGETRINPVIIDQSTQQHTTISTTSMTVNADHLAELRAKVIAALKTASVLITGGSLPYGIDPDYYTDMIQLAHDHDVPVIFDAYGANLSAGLQSKPTFIKPNRDELGMMLGREVTTIDEAYEAGQDILKRHNTQSIITMGSEGALAIFKEKTYRIPSIPIEVVSAAGAGDAILAGLAHALHHNNPIEEGLKLGVALATAVCLHPGTAAYDVANMERFLPKVELIPYL